MKTKNMVVIGMVAGCLMMVAGAGWAAAPDNGTVTANGLVWLKDDGCLGTMTWDEAMARAQSLRSGACGLNDGSTAGQWRLPTKDELSSIRSSNSQFSNVNNSYYWSSTPVANYPSLAGAIGFGDSANSYYNKSNYFYVRCVRSGP